MGSFDRMKCANLSFFGSPTSPAESIATGVASLPAYSGETIGTIRVVDAFTGVRDSMPNRITARLNLAADFGALKWANSPPALDPVAFRHVPPVPALVGETLNTKALSAIRGITVDTNLDIASRLAANYLAAYRGDLQGITNIAKAVAGSATGGPFAKRALESFLASNNLGLLGAGSFPHYDTATFGVFTNFDARNIVQQLQSLDGRLASEALRAYSEIAADPAFDPTPVPSAGPGSFRRSPRLTPLAFLGWLLFLMAIALDANDQLEIAKTLHLPTTTVDPSIVIVLAIARELVKGLDAKRKL